MVCTSYCVVICLYVEYLSKLHLADSTHNQYEQNTKILKVS